MCRQSVAAGATFAYSTQQSTYSLFACLAGGQGISLRFCSRKKVTYRVRNSIHRSSHSQQHILIVVFVPIYRGLCVCYACAAVVCAVNKTTVL